MQYEIKFQPFSVLDVKLDAGESIECENGAMAWMSENMAMDTNIGGSGHDKGLLGTLGKVAKNALTGENIFHNKYTAGKGPGQIAFCQTFPGEIIPFEIDASNSIVAQKGAYFANTIGVVYDIFFQKKLGAGFFGGEGFIMQKFSGQGIVFLSIGGGVAQYTLGPGESLLVDTGYLAAMDATCSIDIQTIKGVANVLLGGEGLFNTRVTGPGRIWLQTMPINSIASSLAPFMPTASN